MTKRARRIVEAFLLVCLVLVVSAVLWAFSRVRRTADLSCLSAMSASLSRQGAFATAEAPLWRQWSREELLAGLGAEEPGDCPAWWKDDVGLRTRDAGGQLELHLWRRSDPAVAFHFVMPYPPALTRPAVGR